MIHTYEHGLFFRVVYSVTPGKELVVIHCIKPNGVSQMLAKANLFKDIYVKLLL